MTRARHVASVLAALIVAAPAAVPAQSPTPSPEPSPSASASPGLQRAGSVSMMYNPPTGWTNTGRMVILRDGRNTHVFGTAGVPTADDLETFVAARMNAERARGATVTDEGATVACDGDEPAHKWSMQDVSSGSPVVTHYIATLVTGGVGMLWYTHAAAVGPRKDGLAALSSLCPTPAPIPVPVGWTAPKPSPLTRFTQTATSPDGTSTFVGNVRKMSHDRYAAYEKGAIVPGQVIADRTDPCMGSTVRRVDVRNGQQIVEGAYAYVRGFAYRMLYTRPAQADPDSAAERALTDVCRSLAPPGAPTLKV